MLSLGYCEVSSAIADHCGSREKSLWVYCMFVNANSAVQSILKQFERTDMKARPSKKIFSIPKIYEPEISEDAL